MRKEKPADLPAYRLLTGADDARFCQRVSEALAMGYELYGNPSVTYNADKKQVVAAQAVIWSSERDLY